MEREEQHDEPRGIVPGLFGLLTGKEGSSGFGSLLLGVLGFLAGMAVVLYDKDSTDESRAFAGTVPFYLWVILIAGQTALWLMLFMPLAASLKGRQTSWGVLAKFILFAVILVGVFSFLVYRPTVMSLSPLVGYSFKMGLINFLGVATAMLAVLGIWTTQVALERLRDHIKDKGAFAPWRVRKGEDAESVSGLAAFLSLRADMEQYLLAAGVIIGAATLTTGGFRNAILAHNEKTPFPREAVLIYGLFASGMLALVYAPAHVWLMRVRSLLRDKLAPLPDKKPGEEGSPRSWSEWVGERKAVDEFLQVKSGVKSFAGGVSILTPLLGSLISVLIGGK
jgi:hypothetical protein